MKEIEMIFRPDDNIFTVFVVEQRFAVGRGYEYFRSFRNTNNFLDTEKKMRKQFGKAIESIEQSITPVSAIVSAFTSGLTLAAIPEIISSLSRLFTVHEHYIVGPEVIDPIIIQEGKVTKRGLARLVNINKDSILQPTVIVILKDNDFDRAKILLSECPHGINIKLIRNSGEEELCKVINPGSKDFDSFIKSFGEHCYSTCSKTKKDVLLNTGWSGNTTISKYSPSLLKARTNLLFDQKDEVRGELDEIIYDIERTESLPDKDIPLLQTIECITRLFRVFCNDRGGQDIIRAEKLARQVKNDVLLAHVYRYAEFLPNCSERRKEELYDKGYSIFRKQKMEDHAIYCRNNRLVHQFYSDIVNADAFRELQVEAVNNVPGMVGLSHIYNNVGIAYLYCGNPTMAIDFLTKGLDYAKYQDRIVQNLALESNRIIAENYSFIRIEESRLQFLIRRIFDGLGTNRLPFLAADYALNILAVAFIQNPDLGYELVNSFPFVELLNKSFASNPMGSGERLLQMQFLEAKHYSRFGLLHKCAIEGPMSKPSGKRMEFIVKYGLNPSEFNTWL